MTRYRLDGGVLVELTPEELTELEAQESAYDTSAKLMEELRHTRNSKLAETDWWVMPDRTATQAQLDYRQALRDITNTYSSLDDVVWPEKPE